jgi:dinuclear metal center YbgI/SA1388 family protein
MEKSTMIDRQQLVDAFDRLLQPALFKDFCPNGLQVEGRSEIRKIVSGVTASLALIEAAVAVQADAVLVHHGLFWRGSEGRITGWMRQRLGLLLLHNINLLAYHLPLDAHESLGNNAQLGQLLGFRPSGRFGDQQLGWLGDADAGLFSSPQALAQHVEARLGRAVIFVQGRSQPIRRVAWCTGGAQGFFEAAIAAGADAFLTGEISEPQTHYARECGVSFLACGHHATERYGAPAVATSVAAELGIEHQFIDIDNPA